MKYLFLVLIAFIWISRLSAQNTCCSPTEAFASLGEDEQFRNMHDEPLKFTLEEPKGSMIEYPTPDSDPAMAYLIPSKEKSGNYLFVIHEWWGLNDQIKMAAEQFHSDLSNVNVICLDLYDGQSTDSREKASELMQGTEEYRVRQIVQGAIDYVGYHAKVSTVGWCFGGGWSLQTSIMLGKKNSGCIIYYGMPELDTDKLNRLEGDVLGIFALKDGWITPEIVSQFEEKMVSLEKNIEILSYDANHAFANPSNPNYNKKAARKAYDVSLDFLRSRF